MTTLDFAPCRAPSRFAWRLQTQPRAALAAPSLGRLAEARPAAARWRFRATWENLAPAERQAIEARLARMATGKAAARLPFWPWRGARGAATAAIVASGSAGAVTLTTVDPVGAGALVRGDLLTIDGWLYVVTADTTAAAEIAIAPPLRAIAAGAPVTYDAAVEARVRLAVDGWEPSGGVLSSAGPLADVAATFVEDVP